MPIDARYLLGMAVAFTVFQFAPKIGHGFKAATVKVSHKLHHHKGGVNLPVPDPNNPRNPLGQ